MGNINNMQDQEAPKVKNMDFMLQILAKLNINKKEFSERTGCSQQLISHWFRKDTCRYHTIVGAFEKMGISLSCRYENNPKNVIIETYISKDVYDVEYNGITKLSEKNHIMIDRYISEDRPLKFLALLVKDTGLNLKTFCDRYGLNYLNTYRCFCTDHIKIDQIYDIARKTGCRVTWELRPLQTKKRISSDKKGTPQ